MYLRRTDLSHDNLLQRSLDGESRSTEICTILIIFSALSTIVVSLRTYIRLVLLRTFDFDDGIMVVAQVLAIGAAVAIGIESKYGLGHHTWVQPKEYFVPYMKAFYSSVVVYNVAMCLVKISILLQYRRVFAIRTMQRITLCGVIFMTAWTITIFFLNTLICVPVGKFWDNSIPGRCLDSLNIWYAMAGFNLATDMAIFCLPLPVIRGLQLPRKQKAMLFAVFCLGFFTCIISIIRIRTLKIASSTVDPNWDNVDASIWSFLEVAIAVIAACLPTLRPIFSKMMPRLFGSSTGRSHGQSQYGPYIQTPSSHCLANMPKMRTGTSAISKPDSTIRQHESDSVQLSTHNFESSPLPAGYSVSVSITGGEKESRYSGDTEALHSGEEHDEITGGIHTTTVVMQHVAKEKETEVDEGWDDRRTIESEATL
ncbi:hypothetical protein B0T10DRAFT_523655 [Thelonectria olida]|uniref:Rhodopsin domain-containing protein n=1 Tax=Thelonectria olida TaxID=1576542 RepID=A0A9P8VS23_9HYPO|nr:hypothetical protein B0T10DRAFT_523655 [Thelonectria olida]